MHPFCQNSKADVIIAKAILLGSFTLRPIDWQMQMGGLGFLHYNMTIEEQAEAARQVKQYQRDTAAEARPSLDNHERYIKHSTSMYQG